MSIEKDYDIYIAVCDICGDDICPACQHPSAASDFGGAV